MPWILGLIAAVVITGGLFFAWPDQPDAEPANLMLSNENTNAGETVKTGAVEAVEGNNVIAGLISIPTLMEYQLSGRDLKLGQVLAETADYTRFFITYKSDDLTISGILNIPKGDGPFPVLFLNHGYIDTSVYTNGRGLKREQDYFARNGFAVLHADYRCHAQSDCPDDTHVSQRLNYAVDVMNAVEAVRTSGDSRLSTTQYGMLGHSMGGGVAQVIAVAKPTLVRAAVLYAPVSSDYIDSYHRYIERNSGRIEETIGIYGTLDENPGFWENLSPRTYFSRVQIPLKYFHGTADASVPLEWSKSSIAKLQELHKDVAFVVYQDQPHEFTSYWGDFMSQSLDFFRQNILN